MRWRDKAGLRLRSLFRRARVDDELDRELRFHLEQQIDEHVSAGMSRDEARVAALRAIGNVTHLAEQCRDMRGIALLEDLRRDVAHALRMLRRTPAFAATAVLTLALGIGATTAVYSVVTAVLLAPLPYPNAARLVQIVENVPAEESLTGRPMRRPSMSIAEFGWWRENAQTFSRMAVTMGDTRTMSTGEGTVRLDGARVSPALFAMRDVPPIVGRWLYPDEERPDARVAVLGEATWRRYYAGDPGVVDRALVLDGQVYTIVGVMPPAFGTEAFWIPFAVEPPRAGVVQVVGVTALLKDGIALETAAAEVRALGERLRSDGSSSAIDGRAGGVAADRVRFELVRVVDRETVAARPALHLLIVAVAVVLLIVCANVANLMLVRGTARRAEIRIRRALGAGRARIVRQLLTECLVLSFGGAAVGMALAIWAVSVVRAGGVIDIPSRFRGALGPLGATILPRAAEVSLDSGALVFAVGISVVTGLVFGLAPALSATSAGGTASGAAHDGSAPPRPGRLDLLRRLRRRRSPRRPSGDILMGRDASRIGRVRMGHVLAVVQLALATTLLVGSGLLLRTFVNLSSVFLGFDPATQIFHLVSPGEYSRARKMALAQDFAERLRALPGVEEAGFINFAPLTTVRMLENFYLPAAFEDQRDSLPDDDRSVIRGISPGYLRAMGVRLLEGRWLEERDGAEEPRVMLVNRAWRDRFSPEASPVGTTVTFVTTGRTTRRIAWEIVGVVENMRWRMEDGPDGQPRSELPLMGFMDLRQLVAASTAGRRQAADEPNMELDMLIGEPVGVGFAVRTASGGLSLPVLRGAARAIDPAVAVEGVTTMGQVFSGIIGRPRFHAVIVGLFGAIAALIAAIGIYGVLSYDSSQRTQEFGIRLAIGAQPRQVLGLVLRQGAVLVLLGVASGLLGAAGLTRYLSGMLFGLTPLDAETYVAIAVAFTAVALLASYVPARRATKIDPLRVLRYES